VIRSKTPVSRSFRASNIHYLVATSEAAPYDNGLWRRSRRQRVLAHLVLFFELSALRPT